MKPPIETTTTKRFLIIATSLLCILSACFLMNTAPKDGNDTYDFIEYKSSLIGQTYSLKRPLLYAMNLPTNNCINRLCSFKTSRQLGSISESCTGCLNKKLITTPLRFEYVPKGVVFKIIDSFQVRNKSLIYRIFNSETKMLILKDENGILSEMSETDAQSNFINAAPNDEQEDENVIMRNIQIIQEQGHYIKTFCNNAEIYQKPKKVIIRAKVEDFIQTLKLKDEIQIISNISENSQCITVKFVTIPAYLTMNYYFEQWEVYLENLTSPE